MYLSFEDYQSMGGTLEETTFSNLEFEAASVIDWYTFGRLRKEEYESLDDAVKRCMFSIINMILEKQKAEASVNPNNTDESAITAGITSMSNDGVSVSYNVLSAKDAAENIKSELEMVIRRSLAYVVNSLGQDVLYRGLYPNE